MCSPLYIVFGLLLALISLRIGLGLGYLILPSVLVGGGRGSVEAWCTSALDFEEVLTGATILLFISLLLMWSFLMIRLIGESWIGF